MDTVTVFVLLFISSLSSCYLYNEYINYVNRRFYNNVLNNMTLILVGGGITSCLQQNLTGIKNNLNTVVEKITLIEQLTNTMNSNRE